ncbi:MAG: methionine--tRNA ligase [Chloroflexi bacterium]|nr:methionine--tRNA ligase [Chloroflexota bacterium]
MPETIFIGVAWPYANSSLHLGHAAGSFLPADIFARYHRMKGNRVLMVSGSDQHGTPITVRAEEEGVSPQAIIDRYQTEFLNCFQRLGISFDLFTGTATDNHRRVVQDMFLRLLKRGYIYKKTTSLPYSTVDKRFLPDRYVEGTCPFCGYESARGDQCDNCGKPMDPKDLKNIRSRIHGDTPEFRDSEHFFIKLTAFEEPLRKWVAQQTHWRPNVRNFTMQYLKDGLIDRAATRDIDWGVPWPQPGYESKRIYVWFEAVIGYLSASKEWAQRRGQPDAWKDFWHGDVKPYYFMGKDNIPFHTIIWPAMLMGYNDGLKLPYDVAANEFLNLAGMKFSKSRNWAVWLPDYLDRFQPDPLRYVLSINMPETADTDFTWQEFLRRNNDELVATYGNLVNRVLSFTYRSCNGRIPEHDPEASLGETSRRLIAETERTLVEVDKAIAGCHFKDGIRAAMALAQQANRYLEEQSPWKTIKTDERAAHNALWTGACVIAGLKTMLYPYMPFSSQKVHEYLGYTGDVGHAGWTFERPKAGQALQKAEPLFVKLDEKAVTEEMSGLVKQGAS